MATVWSKERRSETGRLRGCLITLLLLGCNCGQKWFYKVPVVRGSDKTGNLQHPA